MNFAISYNLAEVLIKKIIMKNLFYQGGTFYMSILTILFVITTAWFIYHFAISYNSKNISQEKLLRLFGYGKIMGLFTMIVGITGQMTGLYYMFSTIEETIIKGLEVKPVLIFEAIKVTMIATMYGMLIYLFSILLWVVASNMVERKFK